MAISIPARIPRIRHCHSKQNQQCWSEECSEKEQETFKLLRQQFA